MPVAPLGDGSMDISDAVRTEYLAFDESTRVAKLLGAFEDAGARVVVVTADDGFEGVVTQRQLLGSHHDPDERIGTVMRDDPPRVSRTEDVRETARLMVESQLKLLPVFEGENFYGVITARDLAEAVRPNLDALDVSDVYTQDLISVDPDTELGQIIHTVREQGISRVPVIEEADTGSAIDRTAVGMVSIYDLVGFILRQVDQEEGGDPGGFDGHGGAGSESKFRTHGGWGDRAGVRARLLSLPASDVMNSPVADVAPETPLGDATEEMLEKNYSSLVVTNEGDQPVGIVTLTDVLRSLTWTGEEEHLRVQIFGMDKLTGMSRTEVAELIEEVDEKYAEMDVIEAYVVLHEHDERTRGMPLIRATIRLFTNKGRFAGTGEEYGAGAAIREARDNLERNVLDDKEYADDRRRFQEEREEVEELVGWWLQG
ncbi:MAG: CBS domain-containing protein [Haloarculaceae archaeon]